MGATAQAGAGGHAPNVLVAVKKVLEAILEALDHWATAQRLRALHKKQCNVARSPQFRSNFRSVSEIQQQQTTCQLQRSASTSVRFTALCCAQSGHAAQYEVSLRD